MTELEALQHAEQYVADVESRVKDYKDLPIKMNPDEHLERVLKVARWLRTESDR